MNINLIDKLSKNKVLPIIRSAEPQKAYDTARAIIDGGLDVIEITIENPRIFNVINELSKETIICAGGIITSIQAQIAIENGAKIISSPIFQQNLVKISKDKQVPLIAGTSSANEAYSAWKARIPLVKIYPANALGGADYIENLLRPMPFLNLIPQGDVAIEQVPAYIKAGAIAVGIGRNITEANSYSQITERVKRISELLK
ncbi:hypothetical protein IJ579_03520 [bacterium]|nr:hypothetical protein [bacterium]